MLPNHKNYWWWSMLPYLIVLLHLQYLPMPTSLNRYHFELAKYLIFEDSTTIVTLLTV